jgi:uncharacterized repeat protein (TIGR01451 family)
MGALSYCFALVQRGATNRRWTAGSLGALALGVLVLASWLARTPAAAEAAAVGPAERRADPTETSAPGRPATRMAGPAPMAAPGGPAARRADPAPVAAPGAPAARRAEPAPVVASGRPAARSAGAPAAEAAAGPAAALRAAPAMAAAAAPGAPAGRRASAAAPAASAAGTAATGPTLKSSYTGFTDVNGNGMLDCGEPVDLVATFATNNSGTPALTGSLFVPAAGSAGLAFLHGSVVIDPDLTNGCTGTVVLGNGPNDSDARIDFSCPADPLDNDSWTLVVRYRAAYDGTGTPQFTAAAQAYTSDGASYFNALTQTAGSSCGSGGVPAEIAVAKTAAGPATPSSLLVYTITATDQSGDGAGGLQVVEPVPAHTTFSPTGSSPGWVCSPNGTAGSVCRNPVGNLTPNGTLSTFFAVTLGGTLPAAPVVIANTACVQLGPTVVAGCASLSTPTAGTPTLHLAKSLASGSGVPGSVVVYSLAAANTGNQDLADAILMETVPALTTFTSAGSSPGWSCATGAAAGTTCTLDLGALAAGASAAPRTFAVTVEDPLPVLPPGSAISNTACLQAGAGAAAALGGAVAGLATAPLAGTPAGVAAGATLAGASAGAALGSASARAALGGAAAGAGLRGAPAGMGTAARAGIAGEARAKLLGRARTAAVASSCSTVSIPTAGTPMLHTVKTLVSGTAVPGGTLVYDLAVQNTGNEAADVGATEVVPANTTFAASASAPGWTCSPAAGTAGATCTAAAGVVLAGATAHLAFALTVHQPLAAGVTAVANTACFVVGGVMEARPARPGRASAARRSSRAALPGATGTPSCDTLSTPTLGAPVITLEKVYNGPAAAAGALLTFGLTAANSGNQDAAAVTLTETVPAHTTFSSAASSPGWSCAPAAGTAGATCSLAAGPLAAGASVAANFAVRADSPLPAAVTQIANIACAAASGLAPSCGQAMTPTPPGVPAVAAELSYTFLHNALGNGLATAGDVILYNLMVSNPSTATAAALVVIVPLDAHLTLNWGSVTTTAGTVTAGNAAGNPTPAVKVPSLAAGASLTITFAATVGPLPAALKLLSTQATLTGSNFAPTVSDDPSTPAPLDPTTTPVGSLPPQMLPIPTLGSWGLAALAAALGGVCLRRMRPRIPPRPAAGGDGGGGGAGGQSGAGSDGPHDEGPSVPLGREPEAGAASSNAGSQRAVRP